MTYTETPEQIVKRFNLRIAEWFSILDQVAEYLDDYGAYIGTTPDGKIVYTDNF